MGKTPHRMKGGHSEQIKKTQPIENWKCTPSVIEVLSKVFPSEMKDAQQSDPTTTQVVQWVKVGNKIKLSQIRKVKSKNVRKYLHQFYHLEFKKGVLHQIYEVQGSKYHQVVLPAVYRA